MMLVYLQMRFIFVTLRFVTNATVLLTHNYCLDSRTSFCMITITLATTKFSSVQKYYNAKIAYSHDLSGDKSN